MHLNHFSRQHRLHVRRDPCGDSFIFGRFGTISDYGADLVALTFLADANDKGRDNVLRSRIRRALAAGFQPSQLGDFEAVLVFDSSDHAHARLAIQLAGIKRRRRAAGRPFTSSRAKEIGKATQFRPSRRLEGPERPQTRGIGPGVEEMAEPELIGSFRPAN